MVREVVDENGGEYTCKINIIKDDANNYFL